MRARPTGASRRAPGALLVTAAAAATAVTYAGCAKTSAPPLPAKNLEASVATPPSASAARPMASAAPIDRATRTLPPGTPKVIETVRSEAGTVETTVLLEEPDADETARTYSTWFLHDGRRQLLATNGAFSNAEAVQEPPVGAKLEGDRIHYQFDGQQCPSNWVGQYEADFTTEPLAVVRERVDSWHRMQECSAIREEWSWKDFAGKVTLDCAGDASCTQRESQTIPQVTLPAAYDEADWTCHRIDGCSAVIDGTKGHGYVTFGRRLERDPVMRAVISGRWLFVQIDGAVDGAPEDDRHWVSEDHVEVWIGATPLMGECSVAAPAVQWGVRVRDAHVFPGAGHPTMLHAERASCGPTTVVLRIELPKEREALTVAYSAGGAHEQRLLMATSPLKYGDPASLGTVKKIDPKRAVCVAKGEGLAPKMTPVARDAPLASFE